MVKSDGTKLIAVQRTDLDLDDPKARALALADNRAGELGLESDSEVLQELSAQFDLAPFFDLNELNGLGIATGEVEAPEPKLDQAEELQKKWKAALAQIWTIPSKSMVSKAHRLACGDSTSKTDAGALFGGKSSDVGALTWGRFQYRHPPLLFRKVTLSSC